MVASHFSTEIRGYCSSVQISRRQILIAGAAAAALTTCGRSQAAPGPAVEDALAELEQRYNAKIGFYGANLGSGRTLCYRENDLFATCSTFKAYVAAQILQKDQRGELSLNDPVFIDPAVYLPVASEAMDPHLGGYLPLSELCAAAVRRSDNTAANLMLAMLGGPQTVTELARSVGDDRTWMVRWVPDLNSAIPGDPRDTTTPRAMSTGFRNMLTGDTLDEPHRALLWEWMSTIATGGKRIRAGLPPGWGVADKTGSGDYGSTNDLGVAYGPAGERLQLGVMARTRSDDPTTPYNDAIVADVTRVAVPWLLA
jgi:beta-lactamase class A